MARSFSTRLVIWHARHGRHDLPWQRDPSPWRVWVSEVMLQQTQVVTAMPYFERFIARFPAPADLARASLDEALSYWSGLGYYARARNLHRAAQLAVARHGGDIPRDIDALMTMPGIGRSTAGAILALAYGESYPILDGNVKRVLARHAGIEGWPGNAAVLQTLWTESARRTPMQGIVTYTQAIMDLGATICTRHRPSCTDCPVADDCVAWIGGRQAELPEPRPRRELPLRKVCWLLIRGQGGLLLERRPPVGVWGGLWCLPEVESVVQAHDWCGTHLGVRPRRFRRLKIVRHDFTHFRLEAAPLTVRIDIPAGQVLEDDRMLWYNAVQTLPGGLPTPVTRLLDTLRPQKDPR